VAADGAIDLHEIAPAEILYPRRVEVVGVADDVADRVVMSNPKSQDE
jgi:hypothetical protein